MHQAMLLIMQKGNKTILFKHRSEKYPFNNNHFDLAISFGCFHNLEINNLKYALQEIKRVSKQTYVWLKVTGMKLSYLIYNAGL